MKSPIFRTYEVFTKSRLVPCPRKIRNVDVTLFTGRTLWTRENAEWHHVDTDSGTVIRDVYLGTDRLTEGGARNTTHRPEGIGTYACEGGARNTKRRP